MHATSSYENSGSKVTKIAIVTALHLALGLVLVNMNMTITKDVTESPGPLLFDPGIPPPPPKPLKPVDAPQPSVAPPIYQPKTEVQVEPPPNAPTHTTTERPETTLPPVAGPAVIAPPVTPPPAVPLATKGLYMPPLAAASDCALPNYPATSARNGDTGTVGLALLIAPNGRVADAKVTSTSGFRELDRAAVAALSMCKFKPATNNGVPESAWGKIAYVWTLEQ